MRLRGLVLHLVLLLGVLVSIFPFYWMIVMATNNTSDIYQYPPKVTIAVNCGPTSVTSSSGSTSSPRWETRSWSRVA